MFKYLKEHLYRNSLRYLLGTLVVIIVDALALVTPKIIGVVTDELMARTLTKEDIIFYTSAILAIAIVMFAGRFLWRQFLMGACRDIETGIRIQYFEHLEKLSYNFYIKYKSGDLMSRATNDLEAIVDMTGPGALLLIDAIFISASAIYVMLFNINFNLTLLALIPFPFIALVSVMFGPSIQNKYTEVAQGLSDLSENVRESFAGIRVIKAFAKEDAALASFDDDNKNIKKKSMAFLKVWGIVDPLIMLLATSSVIIAVYYGSQFVLNGSISVGEFVTFITYLTLLVWPFIAMGEVIIIIQRGLASLKRINEVLDVVPDISDAEADHSITGFEPTIEFADMSFCYMDSMIPTLKHISFKVEKGMKLGIVGRSGSGKSTLTNIIFRLQNPTVGNVYIGGHDLMKIPLNVLRGNISYMSQESFIFSKTIKENITLGNEKYTDEMVERYAKIAGIHDEILLMEEGYNTVLAEGGSNLSGGQKQRISIARALITEPKIIVFDDSLSAVDTVTENNVLNNLKDELKGITTIVSTHRISSVVDADLIIIVEDGFISAQGTHEELMANSSFYSELYRNQQSKQVDDLDFIQRLNLKDDEDRVSEELARVREVSGVD